MAIRNASAATGTGTLLGILQAALGDLSGRLLVRQRQAVQQPAGGAAIRQALPPLLDGLLERAGITWQDVGAIGIGFGGPVNSAEGTIA